MAEGNAFRIPAVFSADANLKTGPGLPPSLDPDVDQFPNPVRVDARKGVFLEDSTLDVLHQKSRFGIVTGNAECGLGQVVGAE